MLICKTGSAFISGFMANKHLDPYCQRGIVGIFILILLYGPLAIGAARPIDFAFIQVLVAIALILWSLRFWLNPNHRLLWHPVCWTILAFIILAFFRYREADLEYIARGEFIRILVYAAVFFLTINNLHKQETTQWIAFVLLALATITSLFALYQFFTHAPNIWNFRRPDQYLERGSGTYICPNHFAGFLAMVLPLGIAFLFAGRYGYTFKVFLGYACLVILAGIAATLSRGGWLATGTSLALMFAFLLQKRQSRIPALATLLLLGIAFFVAYQQSDKLQERLQKMDEGGSSAFVGARPAIWKSAWQMWQDHFWWGVGPAHFDYHFPKYRPASIQARPGWVHNDYLNALVDWGIIGASIVGIGSMLIIGGLFQTRRYVDKASRDIGSIRNSNRSAFVLGTLGSGCALALHSFFDFNLHIPANAILAATLLALAASHIRFISGQHWISARAGFNILCPILILALSCFLIYSANQIIKEQNLLLKAESLPNASIEQILILKKAAEAEPKNFETLYAIGEALRARGAAMEENRIENLEAALSWFEAAAAEYPDWAFHYIGIGMTLDHLRRWDEATAYFERALRLDPMHHLVLAYMGWHQINLGDYVGAKHYFDRSLEIQWWDNHIPLSYNRWIDSKLPPTLQSSE